MTTKAFYTLGIIYLLIGALELNLQAQGGFGGLNTKVESISGSGLISFGGLGAWMPSANFYLGGGGFGSMNTIAIREGIMDNFGYGGFMAGYKHPLSQQFSLSIQGLFGSGGYEWAGQNDRFRIIEPSVYVWFKVNHFMAVNVGAQYRWTFLDANTALSSNDLRAGGVQFNLLFGTF